MTPRSKRTADDAALIPPWIFKRDGHLRKDVIRRVAHNQLLDIELEPVKCHLDRCDDCKLRLREFPE